MQSYTRKLLSTDNIKHLACGVTIFCTAIFSSMSGALAWEACPPTVDVKSKGSGPAATITFHLDSAAQFPVDIMWVDFKGKLQKFARIVPGQSHKQSTFVGHEWVAFDGSNCEYFTARPGSMTAEIVTDG